MDSPRRTIGQRREQRPNTAQKKKDGVPGVVFQGDCKLRSKAVWVKLGKSPLISIDDLSVGSVIRRVVLQWS